MSRRVTPYPKEFKEYVENLITYCRNEIWHGVYRYVVEWHYQPITGNPKINAQIEVSDIYLSFVVGIGPNIFERWKEKEYKLIGRTIIHELCHLFFQPIERLALENSDGVHHKQIVETDERQTQLLSVVFMSFFPKDWFMPKVVAAYMAKISKET